MEVQINQGVLHILDTHIDRPVLSETDLALSQDVESFLSQHLAKVYSSDEGKSCRFQEGATFKTQIIEPLVAARRQEASGVRQMAQNQTGPEGLSLIQASQKIAAQIFALMKANPAIPNADLVVVQLWLAGVPYLGILKLNYRESFIHFYDQQAAQANNRIIKQRTGLPGPGNKIEEAALICLEPPDYDIWLIEKAWEIEGEKCNYWSERLLECAGGLSERQKLKAIKKVTENINQRFYSDQGAVQSQVAAAVVAQVLASQEGTTEIAALCQQLYQDRPAAKAELQALLAEEKVAMADTLKMSPAALHRLEKQTLKTASGVEIKIPVALYNCREAVEFINNPDGSVSLLIKNVM